MGRVVARNERDTRSAMASGAGQIETVYRKRLADESSRPGPIGADLLSVEQPVAVVTAGGAEHHRHVPGREGGVPADAALEVRGQPGDLVDHSLAHLDFRSAV